MSQPKVFEFARQVGLETLALMDKIREWQLPVKSHMAALSDELVEEIQRRLNEEKEGATKKKVVAKRVTRKATGTSPAAAKPAVLKSAAKGAAAAPVEPKPKTTVKKASVIRRKAGQSPADLAPEAAATGEEEGLGGVTSVVAPAEPSDFEGAPVAAAASEVAGQGETTTPTAATAAPTPAAGRRNIVGRMDLSRVRQGPAVAAGRTQSGAPPVASVLDTRTPRPTAHGRNIRTGFIAPTLETPDREEELREEEKRKRPAGVREATQQEFRASEFRKREVIFQPKKKKSAIQRDAKKTLITTPKASKRVVRLMGTMKVSEMAQALGIKSTDLIKKLMSNGVMANMNTDLDFDTVALISADFGFEAENVQENPEDLIALAVFGDKEAEPVLRPPVVTVMGHVDHGKTTLLDAIRSANVASGEAGGITQHIGAHKVLLEGGASITFLDTPGHEAFTAMRARGARVTDIAVIVVAADDGVMPQTIEAINHAKAAGVPIVVAVNKVDKPGSNPDRIKQQLTEYELIPEEWGGNTIFCHVSALKKTGIEELLEQLRLLAEIQELRANPKRSATGIVIESSMEKGRGCVATLLVQDGTLEVGQVIVAGQAAGRVRGMLNDHGQSVRVAVPGDPVEVMGLPELPSAGDRFDACRDEFLAQRIAQLRKEKAAAAEVAEAAPKMSLEALFDKVKQGDVKELPIVLKADVAGSGEAVRGLFDKMATPEVRIKVIHSAVGGISESDVLLASTAGGIVLGFNVRPDVTAQRVAKEKGVEVKTYSIIYELMDDVKKAMSGLLAPEIVEKSTGQAEVREVFTVPKAGTIAGCFVLDGKISRSDLVRLLRDGRIIFEGRIGSLRRFKDDVREVASGYECGIGIENFNDIKVGDVIEAYVKEQIVRQLH